MRAESAEPCPACGHAATRVLHRKRLRDREWSLALCAACGQHFTSPIPTDADIASFYVGDYHADLRREGGTEAAFGGKYRRYADMLARHLQRGRVIDVGCSTGLLVKMLRDRGYDAEGVELNQQSASWGSAHFGVKIHTTLLEHCDFAPESLDALLLTDVLEHTRHPRDFLRDARRLIRPGGFVLVTFPDIRSVESRYQRLLAESLRRDWLWRCCHIPLHTWEFTPETARACFEGAGFRVVEFRRWQPSLARDELRVVRMLDWPIRWLSFAPVGARLGTQMEFVIQRTPD